MSTCTLADFVYEGYFGQISSFIEKSADKEGNIDLAEVSKHPDVFWPIKIGYRVIRVPQEEKNDRDRVEELYDRTLDETLGNVERRFLYGEMVRQTEAFLLDHAAGYFASSMLFQRGYAQLKLKRYRDAVDTFELFLRRYPFSPSADGAREWIDKARAALSR
jgi:TolA-binding protein